MSLPDVKDIDDAFNPDRLEQLAEEYDLASEKAIAVEMLAHNYQNNEVAEALGVHWRTVSEWKSNNESFKMALQEREKEVMSAFSQKMNKLNMKSLNMAERGQDLAEQEAEHSQDWKTFMDAAERIQKMLGSHGELMEQYKSNDESVGTLVDKLVQYFSGLSDTELKGVIELMNQTDEGTLRSLGEGEVEQVDAEQFDDEEVVDGS